MFRCLVLLKDGGLYADVDIVLNTDLDKFFTPFLAFAVPRDGLGDYAPNGTVCLWNGIIASAPGHPFLVKAVERLLTHVTNRFDYYDIERSFCHRQGGSTELWKARVLPSLYLTGPCLLGMAVNEGMERTNPLHTHTYGLQDLRHLDSDTRRRIGDVLFLAVSLYGVFFNTFGLLLFTFPSRFRY